MKRLKIKWILQILLILSALAIGFNNCSPSHVYSGASDFSSVQGVPLCDGGAEGLFASTFYPVLKKPTTCLGCHSMGPGKGFFANSDIKVAYSAFSQIGADRVAENAVNPNHNAPYTGAQNQAAIDNAKAQWNKGLVDLSNCGVVVPPPGTTEPDRIETTARTIDLTKPITWSLGTDLIPGKVTLPSLPGAQFEVSVSVYTSALGQTAYAITMPKIIASTKDIHVYGVFIKINGKYVADATTFSYVDEGIYAGGGKLLASGTMLALGAIKATDKISIAFQTLEATTLPPLAPPPIVQFSQNAATVPESGSAAIDVVLDRTSNIPVIVGVSLDAAAMTALKTNHLDATPLSYSPYANFDWDFKFQNLSLVFAPGETKKTVTITIANDQRLEVAESLVIALGAPENAVKGANSTYKLTIANNDVAPTPGVPTFSQLMAPTGVLGYYCVKCHNSVDLQGGYDMSNYDLLFARGILVPGDTKSLMYQRINADDPLNANLAPMPLDGFLQEPYIRLVEQWILDGAKNN